MAMETVAEAIRRLARAGYVDAFDAAEDGLRSLERGTVAPPESFRVDEIVRFEGDSDPGDESAVFALTSKSGAKGTYTVAYGPMMDPLDAEMVRRLGA
jgi:hypothetical protein